jgi:hypothetical protein
LAEQYGVQVTSDTSSAKCAIRRWQLNPGAFEVKESKYCIGTSCRPPGGVDSPDLSWVSYLNWCWICPNQGPTEEWPNGNGGRGAGNGDFQARWWRWLISAAAPVLTCGDGSVGLRPCLCGNDDRSPGEWKVAAGLPRAIVISAGVIRRFWYGAVVATAPPAILAVLKDRVTSPGGT